MVDQAPNIVAIKAEGGMPSLAGFAHAWNRLSERIVVAMPILQQAIPLATLVPMQLIATSNTEYYGTSAPTMLSLARAGKVDEAMDKMWQIMPAIQASANTAPIPNAHAVHRTAWKYQAWLNGYNGGPMRMPAMRLNWKQMKAFRGALAESGLESTSDPDEEFFIGRHPA
jgi:4-hydroxy-tetrahydrodipicolinate synthase